MVPPQLAGAGAPVQPEYPVEYFDQILTIPDFHISIRARALLANGAEVAGLEVKDATYSDVLQCCTCRAEVRVHVSGCNKNALQAIVRKRFFTDCVKCDRAHYRKELPPYGPSPKHFFAGARHTRCAREAVNEASSRIAMERSRGKKANEKKFHRYYDELYKAKEAAILGPEQRAWDVQTFLSDAQASMKKLNWERLCEPVQVYMAAKAKEDKTLKALYFVGLEGDSRLDAKPGEWMPRLVYPNLDDEVAPQVAPKEEAVVVDKCKAKMSDEQYKLASREQLKSIFEGTSPGPNGKEDDTALLGD
ncbi:hypothetical protein BST61_g3639 [Cercospora zeina]